MLNKAAKLMILAKKMHMNTIKKYKITVKT